MIFEMLKKYICRECGHSFEVVCEHQLHDLNTDEQACFCTAISWAEVDPETKKETDKTPLSLVDFEFVGGMARVLAEGNKNGRVRDDWQLLKWTPEVRAQYMDALLRHTMEEFDPAAIACNAMIIAWHDRGGKT